MRELDQQLVDLSGASEMRRSRSVELRSYRSYRIEVLDDGGCGWAVALHGPEEASLGVLRTGEPNGLAALVEQARRIIDQRHMMVAAGEAPVA